jgi:hypothetical protein
MSDFKITKDKFSLIAKKLQVKKTELQKFLPSFNKFYKIVSLQHLAHLMRAMELYVREVTGCPAFRIVWCKMSARKVTSAVSFEWKDKYGIVVPAGLEKNLRDLRVYVAHELGHLFYSIQHPENDDIKSHQDMANIFGVFAMLERNDFYKEKAPGIIHKTCEDVINDFVKFVPKI